MTQNDNFRHYIGELDVTEDIDLMFKHIYDLMLANGGEGSGLNADMIDGYHASDFAPASLVHQLNQYIQTIKISDRYYSGLEVLLELYASDVTATQNDDSSITVQNYLSRLEDISTEHTSAITDLQEKTSFLDNNTNLDKITNFIENNLHQTYDNNNVEHFYIDSDSVNGLSFTLLTQNQYDMLPREQKEDPRNIFIINNNLDEDFSQSDYVPPSILKASMDLRFNINDATHNIEYSIDAGTTKKIAIPIVGTSTNKGVLYPSLFSQVKSAIDSDNDLQNQNDYPFLLNTLENQNTLDNANNAILSIKFDNSNNVSTSNQDGIADISTALDMYLTNWVAENISIPEINIAQYQNINEKTNNITDSESLYPTSRAVKNYVDSSISSLNASINSNKASINHKHTSWRTVTLSDSHASLIVNDDIRIAMFRYFNNSGYAFKNTNPIVIKSGLIPSGYRSTIGDVVLPFYHFHLVGYIDNDNGNLVIQSDKATTYHINTSATWRY